MIEDRPPLTDDWICGDFSGEKKNSFPVMTPRLWSLRSSYRLPTLWMWLNLYHGRCWCGKPRSEFDKYQRKYCTAKHSWWYYYNITPSWNIKQYEILKRDGHKCVLCQRSRTDLEVDHIKAICNGGDPWDDDNLRTLCHECHRVKTRQDRHEQKRNKTGQEVLVCE